MIDIELVLYEHMKLILCVCALLILISIGHVVYVLHSEPMCVFTGDLIFVGGNGMNVLK